MQSRGLGPSRTSGATSGMSLDRPEPQFCFIGTARMRTLPDLGVATELTQELIQPLARCLLASPGGSVVKNLPAGVGDVRDASLIPGSGRSPGGGNGIPLPFSCLDNPMDRRAWQATLRGVANSQT